jgi:hypothetical protein
VHLRILLSMACLSVPSVLAGQGSCPATASPILLLGMYHMNNPGLDAVNVQADDVLTPRRQEEIESVVARLATFRPTKVMVEGRYATSPWPERYREWRAGRRDLGRNEIEQIGFRVAAAAGLDSVTPVDYAMWMNGWTPEEIAPRPPAPPPTVPPPPPAPLSEAERRLTERLHNSTVGEYLAWLNSADYQRQDHAGYMRQLLPPEGSGMYTRADLLANWYKRNIRIAANINREVRHGTDRVLVLYGNGHATILRQLFEAASYFCVEPTAAYLP